MKAMILAAGKGTRLGDLSLTIPKCLVKVGGKTMLEHVVDNLKKAGVDSIVINLHHLASQVEEFINSKNRFGVEVHFSHEHELLETGGGIRHAQQFLDGSGAFLVHNADVYSDLDLTRLWQAHQQAKAIATLAVMERDSSRYLLFDDDKQLVGWQNIKEGRSELIRQVSEPKRLAFSGIQVLSDKIFDYMRDELPRFTSPSIFIKAAKNGEMVNAFLMNDAYWHDIGTAQAIAELRDKIGH